ncbi:hypothetical protein SAY87_022291 [Trapa incisa]|uniref:J domain-containing protein n=1 Tax=Trapa incisa TaxID=236973 RepID=A0AAN7KA05_9MYRT|nr:hypothetical protein SAY87_022291 [Trapa incisa]
MDCNKEEAIRAKTLAEKKMEDKDFHGARKIAVRAQQLYSDLENISQMLMVCEIHCSAEKFVGTQLDWYGILQVERTADEATIKKQYRKFALQLHPDKNKFPGAEAAFKLIGEAQGILLDQQKRRVHDMKCNAHLAGVRNASFSRAATTNHANPKANSIPSRRHEINFRENFASFNIHLPRQPPPPPTGFPNIQPTFWTICPFCSVRYQYHKGVVNKSISCQNCLKNFIAYDLNILGVSPCTNVDVKKPHEQKLFPKHGYSKVDIGPKGSSTAETRRTEVPQTSSKQDAATSSHKVNSRKRKDKGDEESSESINSESSTESEEDAILVEGGHFQGNQKNEQPVRRSGRQRQKVSYKDSFSEDDEEVAVSPQMSEENGCLPDKEDNPLQNDASKPARLDGEKVEQHKKSAVFDESALSDEGSLSAGVGKNPENYEYPDPDFHDFDEDRKEGCFSVGQVWAVYDSLECMPRFYVRIRKVVSHGFKLKVTWLEPLPDKKDEKMWVSEDLPVSCGKFVLGGTEEVEDRLMFSHRMYFEQGNKVFIIYPNKGETWAIFKNWDLRWYSDPDNHKKNEYEFVEILSEYDDKVGINVAYLSKVKSFTSVFALTSRDRTSSFRISPEELYRFSHRIPSFKLTGEERVGVPKGCFELDPASISFNIKEIDLSDCHGDVDEVRAQGQSSHTGDKVTQHSGTHAHDSSMVEPIQIPDSEFHNFDVSKSFENFHVGQVWALYSDEDCLPKYYCQIVKVISSPQFKLHIRWLSFCALPNGVTGWKNKDMPISCGIFKVKKGNPDIYTSTDSFSHCMKAACGKPSTFEIFPEKGDVWALYKYWNLMMDCNDLENCDYDFGEVIERNDAMVRVSVLERVDGFNSVFKYQLLGRSKVTLEIPIAEILKFSHQVPAIQLAEERNGSLRGCWELDPAALPVHLFRSN